ncbi:hypothetical protein [Jannaschia sp. W003]|uniref:hypothetical protein n=1 Tax=Jannaschia sp. W003 TaxID=2867012 RepID=UPI0021A7C5E4|nr:hypothetical protein [Jannaschia sp. W003]UWQ21360.1 hypothetical protein K3554_15540 [Jannaschia sp. W003]
MRLAPLAALPLLLAACNAGAPAPSANPSLETARSLAEGRSCPLAVPERDALLGGAIAAGDAAPIDAFLDARPEDPVGLAAIDVVRGQPVRDPDQLACLAPFL